MASGRHAPDRIRIVAAVQICVAIALGGPAAATPAIPAKALPVLVDPLSQLTAPAPPTPLIGALRPDVPPGAASGAASDAAPASPFSIIGEPGAETLPDAVPDDTEDGLRDRFLGIPQPDEPEIADGVSGGLGTGPQPVLTLGAITRSLMNASGTGGGTGGQGNRGGSRLQESASFLDETIAMLVLDILNPEFETEGLVTFSIAGFGSFALILSEETGSVFFVDLDSGTAIKVHEDNAGRIDRNVARLNVPATVGSPQNSTNGLQRILAFLDQYVFPVLTSPITMAAFGLFAIIWLVWRLSASRA